MKKGRKTKELIKLLEYIMAAVAMLLVVMLTKININASEGKGTDYGLLVEALEDELRNGNLSSEEDVRNAIDKVEEKYGMEISDSDEDKLVKMVGLAEDMGIDGNKMADIVDEVYDKAIDGQIYDNTEDMIQAVEEQMIDSAADAVKDTIVTNVKKSISDYYSDFIDRIKYFWSELTSKWKIS